MKVQDYSDWQGRLAAVTIAATQSWRQPTADEVQDTLAGLNGDPGLRQAGWSAAEALGIHKRRKLAWTDCSHPAAPDHPAFAADLGAGRTASIYRSLMSDPKRDWCGSVEFDDETELEVEGHPSRESATEHLERLIGSLREGA